MHSSTLSALTYIFVADALLLSRPTFAWTFKVSIASVQYFLINQEVQQILSLTDDFQANLLHICFLSAFLSLRSQITYHPFHLRHQTVQPPPYR